MNSIEFRPCGECSACCDGHYSGAAYGNKFGNGKPCVFLLNSLCTIYTSRPGFCKTYQCAWSQHLLDSDMRPDRCGLMVSVENCPKTGKQILKAVEIWENVPYESYSKLAKCAQDLNTQWILVKYNR